jgi:Protein of unknown function (DUF2892)
MNRNMGTADRAVRSLVALVGIILIVNGTLDGLAAWVVGAFAVIFLATSAVSFCPLYTLLGLRTCPLPKQNT